MLLYKFRVSTEAVELIQEYENVINFDFDYVEYRSTDGYLVKESCDGSIGEYFTTEPNGVSLNPDEELKQRAIDELLAEMEAMLDAE